ncbi:unnamed protein product [Sphacelaria rigidula]
MSASKSKVFGVSSDGKRLPPALLHAGNDNGGNGRSLANSYAMYVEDSRASIASALHGRDTSITSNNNSSSNNNNTGAQQQHHKPLVGTSPPSWVAAPAANVTPSSSSSSTSGNSGTSTSGTNTPARTGMTAATITRQDEDRGNPERSSRRTFLAGIARSRPLAIIRRSAKSRSSSVPTSSVNSSSEDNSSSSGGGSGDVGRRRSSSIGRQLSRTLSSGACGRGDGGAGAKGHSRASSGMKRVGGCPRH